LPVLSGQSVPTRDPKKRRLTSIEEIPSRSVQPRVVSTVEAMETCFSNDRKYRYTLVRDLGPGPNGTYVFIGKNPAKATEDPKVNDGTITRVMTRARDAGYSRLIGLNIYAWVSPDPRGLLCAGDPIGPENLSTIKKALREADYILCGWGWAYVWPPHAAEVEKIVRASGKPAFCLGKFKDGTPFHPVRQPYSVEPIPF